MIYYVVPTGRDGERMSKGSEIRFDGMVRTALTTVIGAILFSLSPLRPSLADLPYLHERIASILYGPAYRALFADAPSIPTWIQTYNSTLNGVELSGTRVFLDGNLFERYKVCENRNYNTAYIVVLFTPGGRQAWAISMLGDQPPVFFGHPDPVVQKVLISATTQPDQ